jgi:hypothetical protein
VAAHDLAHGRIAFNAAQQIVFLGGHHRGVSLIARFTQIPVARSFLDI